MIKNFINTIKVNIKTIFIFEFLFKLLSTLIFIPMSIGLFELSMKITGYNYITLENIFGFIFHPISILFFLLIIIFLTTVTFIDYLTITIIYDASYHNVKIGVKDTLINSYLKFKKLFKFKNILLSLFILLLIPLLNIGFTSNVISIIKIPEFILDFIYANSFLSILFTLLYVFLIILFMKWIYSMNYMILEDKDFKESIKCSKKLTYKNKFKDFLKILLFQIIIYVFYTLIILLGIIYIYLIYKLLSSVKIVESLLITIIWIFMIIMIFIFLIISNCISYLFTINLYYIHKNEKKELIKESNYIVKSNNKNKKNYKYIVFISLIIFIIFGCILTYDIISGKTNLNIENVRNMELTAHRGASKMRPENTMSSFVLAKELGADYIELDVQQTKDKQIVVSHDTNIYRVSGIDKDIIDLEYEELSKIDVGSFFDKKYSYERMPLLKQVLEYAKNNNIKLNIELKPTGKEVDFEKQVVDLVNEYNLSNKCVITSQVYEVLENIKKYDNRIKTIYVMSIALGNITLLDKADGYSLEASNVNESIVSIIHNNGKEVYAWTINTEESINSMIDMKVDNIITDNVTLGKKLLIESKQSNLIIKLLKCILNMQNYIL